MKKEWSKKWVKSKQPRKQRKYKYNAPLHVRHKFVSAHLSPVLRDRYGRRSMPLRKGDKIRIMRGESRGLSGTVDRVDLSRSKIYVENVKAKKVDGSEVFKQVEPSNVMITELKLDDKKRQAVLKRSQPKEKPEKQIKESKKKELKDSKKESGKKEPEKMESEAKDLEKEIEESGKEPEAEIK
jgi:large subunit ribosomal protein L24